MRLKCKVFWIVKGESFVGSRSEITVILATAEAFAKAAPKGFELSDAFRYRNGEFLFEWKTKRDGEPVDEAQNEIIESAITQGLTDLQQRRKDANENNLAIVEHPSDAKFVVLNKALSDSKQQNVEMTTGNGNPRPVNPVDPRKMVLRTPVPEPVELDLDVLVTGSNVVGGDVQLSLFDESMVDVVFFVRGGPISEIRACLPIRLANVRNLVTHIRVHCIRARPDDNFVIAVGTPSFYLKES
jgi:hypothetical protein